METTNLTGWSSSVNPLQRSGVEKTLGLSPTSSRKDPGPPCVGQTPTVPLTLPKTGGAVLSPLPTSKAFGELRIVLLYEQYKGAFVYNLSISKAQILLPVFLKKLSCLTINHYS